MKGAKEYLEKKKKSLHPQERRELRDLMFPEIEHEHATTIDMGRVYRGAHKDALFRRIVRKSMLHAGIVDLDQQSEFIEWLIGKDYQTLPYMLKSESEMYHTSDDWLSRIRDRARILNIDGNTPVYQVLRASAEIWKQKRILVAV